MQWNGIILFHSNHSLQFGGGLWCLEKVLPIPTGAYCSTIAPLHFQADLVCVPEVWVDKIGCSILAQDSLENGAGLKQKRKCCSQGERCPPKASSGPQENAANTY